MSDAPKTTIQTLKLLWFRFLYYSIVGCMSAAFLAVIALIYWLSHLRFNV